MQIISKSGGFPRMIGGQYFFGYYDNRAFHPDGKLHLCHRVPFMDRLPTGEDECELGSLDMDTGVFSPVALTRSWNFQQGAMLQWNPVNPDEIIYNDFIRIMATGLW